MHIAILGLGEAGSIFANDLAAMGITVSGWDPNPIRTLNNKIRFATSNADAAKDADIIFSVNLSSVSEQIATEVLPVMNKEKIYVEMNTSSPDKKIAVYNILQFSGVQYVDLAIMAPVPPKGIKTPFLASGPGAKLFKEKLSGLHLDIDVIGDKVGDASTKKLLRSIVYKGVAAVICEAVEAGKAFESEKYIREQISSVIGGNDELINRFLEGSVTHAERRLHEMEAVVKMLAPQPPKGEQMVPYMSMATIENLKKYIKLKNETANVPPSGVRGLSIPYMQFRGGSSKGLFFKATDLPADEVLRNKIILAAMEGVGSGDPRQIDGLGGATSLTSKVAIVSLSKSENTDLDYLFLQVVVGKGKISTTQTCGNILAAVLPFAIESGMLKANEKTTSAKIKMMNTGGICEVTVQTPNGKVEYAGTAKVDGVPGTAAEIICNYLETEGSTCGTLLPTGNIIDIVDGIEITCIDNGMPEVILRATDLGITGNETPTELDANEVLKQKLESIRLQIGPKMNLGDIKEKTIPKMCIISAPVNGGAINTRTFIPHVCHEAIGVLGAVSTATSCLLKGSVAEKIAAITNNQIISVEHPTGEFTVNLETLLQDGKLIIVKSGVIRTARLLSKGVVYIPAV